MFQMLAKLHKLEYVNVLPRSGQVWGARPLIAIEHGLHHLGNLKQLQEVHGDFSLFTAASARWLAKFWPNLEQIRHYLRRQGTDLPAQAKEIFPGSRSVDGVNTGGDKDVMCSHHFQRASSAWESSKGNLNSDEM